MDKAQRDRLLLMGEEEASKLPREDWYDRIRLLRQRIAYETLNSLKGLVATPPHTKKAPRASNNVISMYKNWVRD